MYWSIYCIVPLLLGFARSEYECGPFIKSINLCAYFLFSFIPFDRFSLELRFCVCLLWVSVCVVIIAIVDPFLLLSNEMEHTTTLEVQVPLLYSKSYSYYNPCMGYLSVLFPLFPHTWHVQTPSTKCLGLSISVFTFKYPIRFVLCQIKDALDASSSSFLLLHIT